MLSFYLLACAQIILESFPISSSGHVLLLQKLFADFFAAAEPLFQNKLVDHFLHGPTVFVLIAFFIWRGMQERARYRFPKNFWFQTLKFFFFIFLADLVTAIFFVGFMLFKTTWFPLGVGFLCSAVALFSLYFVKKGGEPALGLKEALVLGVMQGLALFPGVSRFAFVFVAARWLGFSCKRAFDITFAVQLPLIAAAFANSFLVKILFKHAQVPDILLQPQSLILFACASVIAFFALLFVRLVLCKQKAWMFALYLLIPMLVSFFV